ncbi:MAG: SGNH/GDSL hydrolase family protein [Chlamydiia bacterium]|nr:SGNH/GDSL hydrolase family protein [Chlamydiia bacterium]
MVNHSITQLAEAYANDDFTGIVSLQKSLYKQAMDLIKRNLIITLRDLRKLAPHSKIVVLTPAFPFGNLRHDLTEGKMEELGNNNLHELFNVFKNSIKAAANQGSVADYYNIDDIADFKNNSEKITTGGIERLRKMPNAGDIHPSTYGHQLIGNGLFKLLKNQLGLTGPATHLVVGHAPNNDDKADLTLNNIYSPEYFDESTSPKLNRGLDELVRGIMTNPKKSFTNVLINSLDKILGLFNNGVSKTNNFYRVSSEEFTKEEIFTDPKPGFMDSLTGGQELFGFFKGLKGRQKKGVGTLNMMLSAGYSYASPADKLSMKTAMKKFHDDHLFTKVQLTTIQAVMKSIEGTIIKDTDTSIGTINAAALETTYGVKSVKEFLSKYKMSYMIKKYVNRAYIHIVFGNLSDTNPASTRAQDGPLQIMREFGFDEMIDVLDKTGMKYDKTKLTSTYNVGVAKFNTIFGEFNRKELINLNTKFINALNPFMKFLNEDPIDSFTNIIDPAKHQSGQLSQLFGKQFANINDPKVGKFVRADAKQISAQLQGDILAAYESFLTKHTDQEFTTIFKFLAKLSDSNGIVYVQNSFDLDKLKEI